MIIVIVIIIKIVLIYIYFKSFSVNVFYNVIRVE